MERKLVFAEFVDLCVSLALSVLDARAAVAVGRMGVFYVFLDAMKGR